MDYRHGSKCRLCPERVTSSATPPSQAEQNRIGEVNPLPQMHSTPREGTECVLKLGDHLA